MVNHEDFEVEYEIESTRKGITGSVTSYTFASKEYPYILLDDLVESGTKAKLLSLKGIITPPATKHIIDKIVQSKAGKPGLRYNVYTNTGGEMYLLGVVSEERLSSIIDSVGLEFVKEVALSNSKVFTGTMIYTLVPVRS